MVSLVEAGYLAIAFVVYVVIVSIGGSVLTGIQGAQITQNAGCIANPTWVNCSTAASNASLNGLTGIGNLSSQSSVIGTVLGAVVLIGLLMGAFYVKGKMEE